MNQLKRLDEIHARNVLTTSDINEHLDTLCALSRDCNHVTEFGIRHGVSTLSIFRGLWQRWDSRYRQDALEYHGYDIHLPIGVFDNLIEFVGEGLKISIFEQDSKHGHINPTDMLFIDSLHTYDQCFAELINNAEHVRKYIVLHDTNTFGEKGEDGQPGLLYAIQDFMEDNIQWRVRSVVQFNNGLTILERL